MANDTDRLDLQSTRRSCNGVSSARCFYLVVTVHLGFGEMEGPVMKAKEGGGSCCEDFLSAVELTGACII
jgi:hypothetical protein